MELLIALRIRQFRFLMALGRLVKAEGLVCEQFLAHGKYGREKGEPDRSVSLLPVIDASSLTR